MITLNVDYVKCKEVVEKLNNHFENKVELANVDYPSNINYRTNEYYLYMFY